MRYVIVITGILLQATTAWCNNDRPVKVPNSADGYIGNEIGLFEDTTASMTVEEVLSTNAFVPSSSTVPNLGISSSTFWVSLTVQNASTEGHVLLQLDHAEVESIDLYAVTDDRADLLSSTGQLAPVSSRALAVPEFVFSVPINPGMQQRLLLRLTSSKQLQVPLKVYSTKEFVQASTLRNLYIGGYIGIMLALALYNLFVYFSTLDRTYIIYVGYIILVAATQLAFWGVGQFYIWSGSPWLTVKASIILTFATALMASGFMRRFLNTAHRIPRLHAYNRYFYAAIAVVMVIYLFISPPIGYRAAQVVAGMFAYYLFISAWKVWRQGSRQGGFFLISWTAFLVGTMIFSLKDMGILPYNSITVFAMPIGSAFEGIMLSLALADRINVLRREKERSQAEALATSLENQRIVREQNMLLEVKVAERTHELKETNEHLKRTQTQLVNAEKMASLGQLTAGIAHEINNPINFITSNIHPLRRNIAEIVEVMQEYRTLTPESATAKLPELKERERRLGIADSIEELQDIIGSIAEGSSRTAEIVRGLRNFSRLDEDDLKDSDLHEGLQNTLALLAPHLRDKVQVRCDFQTLPLVECFPGKVNQVFMNVLTNAIQATMARTDGGTPEVSITTATVDDQVRISIHDNGIGMSDEVMAHMFDPFFTTKPVGKGTGLGLSISYAIVEQHGGHLSARNADEGGAEFLLELPLA